MELGALPGSVCEAGNESNMEQDQNDFADQDT